MEKPDVPGAMRALRQAQLYGYLVARHGRLHHPRSNYPLCGVQSSKDIVRSGWLRFRSGKYEITPEGLRALAAAEHEAGLDLGDETVHGRRTAGSYQESPTGVALWHEAQVVAVDNFDVLRDPAFWITVLLAVTPIVLVVTVILFVQQ
jgi:hypothetical protein